MGGTSVISVHLCNFIGIGIVAEKFIDVREFNIAIPFIWIRIHFKKHDDVPFFSFINDFRSI